MHKLIARLNHSQDLEVVMGVDMEETVILVVKATAEVKV